MINMRPEKHDLISANSQFLTHLIGRVIDGLKPVESEIDTDGYKLLLQIKEHSVNDSWELFIKTLSLDKRIGEYGQSIGLPDPSMGDPAAAQTAELPKEEALSDECNALEAKAKQSIDHCAGAPEKEKFNCTLGIYAEVQMELSKTPTRLRMGIGTRCRFHLILP